MPASALMDDDKTELDALRGKLPAPDDDVADELADALAHSRYRAETFGVTADVTLDRYVLRRELGRGGMGVVFEAYDPLLMIPVALKLLQKTAGGGHTETDHRKQREAQALAAVEGDHVVRVYSAGFYKHQAWIAMQFVAGPDLSEWLRYQRTRGPLQWRDVLAKFIDAARGLISIHEAGLIHRDFKPQNAVVDPKGRVRVLDFGLATHDRRPVDPVALAQSHLRGEGRTATGELVGTLRYASPEQFVGTDLDHRSDQFSFCVALFEGLWGHAPFGDGVSTGRHLVCNDGKTPIPRPTTGDVPGWLVNAVIRGLGFRPEQRHRSMAALLHELTRDRRRPKVYGGMVLGGVLCGGLVIGLGMQGPDPLETCLEGQASIDALASDGPAQARRVAAWKDAYATACHETHRGSVPDTLLARRQACLAADRKTLAAVVARAPVDQRARVLGELPPSANCLDVGLGRVAAPRDAGTRARVAEVDEKLAQATAGRLLGDYAAAAETAREAVDIAATAEHEPALARAHFTLGTLERLRGRNDAAEVALVDAAAEASESGDVALAVDAWHELVRLSLLGDRAAENAGSYLQLSARQLSTVLHDHDASAAVQSLQAEHADMRGLLAYADRRYAVAITDHSEAVDRWRKLIEVTDVRGELAASLLDRGRAHSDAEDHTAAIRDYTEAIDLELARHGAEHPSLAANHRALALEHIALGDYPAAERAATRALAIDTAAGSHDVAVDHQTLAKIGIDSGGEPGVARAAVHVAAMQASIARNPDASPELHADAAYFAALVATARGDQDTETRWSQVAAAYAVIPGLWGACQQAQAFVNQGRYALEDRRFAAAEALATRAAEVLLPYADRPCEAAAESKWLRGHSLVVQQKFSEALPLIEAAAISIPNTEVVYADVQADLARTLHALHRDPDRVRVIVAAAQRHYNDRNLQEDAAALGQLLEPTSAPPR